MISLLIASLIIPSGILAQDCTIVKNAWAAMGKPAVSSTTDCCTMTGVTCVGGYVTSISWSSQGLTGSIPSSLGSLTQLTSLFLTNNQLNGTIPASLGNLSALNWMYLFGNKLSGPIPSSLGNLAKLTALALHTNQLNGTIPSSLGNLAKLTTLGLQSNQLTGTIPTSLGNLTQLTYLSLSSNQLSGNIPSSLGNLNQLTELYLHLNKLDGTIPSSLGYLTKLIALYLSSNQLNGTIPSTFGNLSQLNFLYLYTNKLDGSIPSSFGNLGKLNYLFLFNNRLSGNIPSSLGNLVSLKTLWLHNNSLTGVPSSFSNLTNTSMILLPNPMSLIPYDLIVKNPVSTMSVQNLTAFLATSKLAKRQATSSVATLTTDQLLAMCPLNYVANQDILAGCVAGIVYFCQGQTDLTQCQRYYDTVFSYSIFAPIGANCPAWKYGPRSLNCNNTVNAFSVNLTYTSVNKDFATFFAKTLFADKTYAPCITTTTVKCTW